jgi:F-type H+-transporting ATPase subunit b
MIEIDIPTIVWEILNFLALSALLYFFLFKKVIKKVEERTKEKERMLDEIQHDRIETAQIRQEIESRLARLETEAEVIVSEAQLQIEQERESAIKKTQIEAERILNQALEEADQLKNETLTEFQEKIVSTIIEISVALIHQVGPLEMHTKLVTGLFEKVWEMGRSDMQQVSVLRRSLGEREPVITVETAYPLNTEQQRTLIKTFSALADRNVNVELKEYPGLSAGIRVRIGDLIIDNTVAAQLAELEGYAVRALKEKMADA